MSDFHFEGRTWLAVASAEHVRHGLAGGFVQVSHGRLAPLRRIGPGDCLICYSPSTVMRGKDRLQSFTAIGTVRESDPYQVEMTPDFSPYRRDVG